MDEQHIYHHATDKPRVNVKAERNSKGWNYEATVIGADTPDEAMALLKQATALLEAEFGNKPA